uniref:Fibulin 7 n=1 Tax=Cyanistes caeruleus TaxID=156563 RepID=A0A8C0UL16_CYACU
MSYSISPTKRSQPCLERGPRWKKLPDLGKCGGKDKVRALREHRTPRSSRTSLLPGPAGGLPGGAAAQGGPHGCPHPCPRRAASAGSSSWLPSGRCSSCSRGRRRASPRGCEPSGAVSAASTPPWPRSRPPPPVLPSKPLRMGGSSAANIWWITRFTSPVLQGSGSWAPAHGRARPTAAGRGRSRAVQRSASARAAPARTAGRARRGSATSNASVPRSGPGPAASTGLRPVGHPCRGINGIFHPAAHPGSPSRRFPAAPPGWSVSDDPAFSRQPRCAQLAQSQQCSCDPGFQMSGTASNGICQDLDECEVYQQEGGPRLCAHACINTPGSFRCSCPAGYVLLGDGKSCEDIDECSLSQDNCTSGSSCINTGGGFQCVTPECPPAAGNISYVKTSPFRCERNPCPMESRSCHQAPKTISFHYLPLPSKARAPVPLFRMAPGRPGPDSLRFGIAGGSGRGHFAVRRSERHAGELLLLHGLQGPRTLHVDVDMAEYLDRAFQAKHLSKITLFVSAYEF